MFIKKKRFLALIAAGLVSAITFTAQADIVVVGSPDISVGQLSVKQTEKIWLGKTHHLPDGNPVVVSDQEEGSRIRDDFYEKVAHKNPSQVKAYWTRLIFTGKASAPKVLRDDRDVKQWVSETPGGLGYIDKTSVDDSVKVLLTLP
jgi:ABC-type phosphate transport system substrate-binding protein